jgi:hypothetical protein
MAMGLLLAVAWADPATTSKPTSEASTEPTTATSEPATAASEPTTTASTEPTTSTSEPTTAATIGPTTASTSKPVTAPSESSVAAKPAPRPTEAIKSVKVKAATFDDYRIVFERNIFLKDRMPKPVRSYTPRPRPPTQPAPPQMVLTGVTIRDEVRLAFFEDSQNGNLIKAIVGDVLQGGKVVSITLDGVEVSLKGKTKKVAIGESIIGGGPVDISSVGTSESTAAPASGSTNSTGSGDDILERMKKRRQKELKP